MRKLLPILCAWLLLWSCDSDDSQELLVKNATITIDESEVDNCLYTIKTEDKEFYYANSLPASYSENSFEAKITYKLTEERGDCGFGGFLYKIEILELMKL